MLVSPLFSSIISSSRRLPLLRRPPVCLPGLSMGTGASDGGASSSPSSAAETAGGQRWIHGRRCPLRRATLMYFQPPGFFVLVCPSALVAVAVAVASPDRQTRGGRRAHTRPYSRSTPALSADPARKTSPLAPAPRRHVTFSRIRLGGLLAAFEVRRKWDNRGPRSRRSRREMSLHLELWPWGGTVGHKTKHKHKKKKKNLEITTS